MILLVAVLVLSRWLGMVPRLWLCSLHFQENVFRPLSWSFQAWTWSLKEAPHTLKPEEPWWPHEAIPSLSVREVTVNIAQVFLPQNIHFSCRTGTNNWQSMELCQLATWGWAAIPLEATLTYFKTLLWSIRIINNSDQNDQTDIGLIQGSTMHSLSCLREFYTGRQPPKVDNLLVARMRLAATT